MNNHILLFSICISIIAIILVIPQSQTETARAQCFLNELSGIWNGNDGGTYYIQQDGDRVWWIGASSLKEGTGFSNVFEGEIENDIITGKWADVPMGNTNGNGELVLVVETYTKYDENGKNPVTYDVLTKSSERGGFGGTELTRPQPHCGDVNTSDTPEK